MAITIEIPYLGRITLDVVSGPFPSPPFFFLPFVSFL